MRSVSLIIAVLFVFISGCTHEHKVEEEHEERIAITLWTKKSELFMEHDAPLPGKKAGFLIHLTKLADFKPVTEGALVLTFTPQAGAPFSITVDAPAQPGIYKAEATFPENGRYSMTIDLKGASFSDAITGPEILVGGEAALPADEDAHGSGGGDISFLKEQQWTVAFKVEPAATMALAPTFTVMGELVPATNAESTISAPLSGIISASRPLPYIGKKVKAGEILMMIEPPIQQEGGIGQLSISYAEAKSRVILAEKEFERAKLLYGAKAAPRKRLEEAEIALGTAKASLEPLERAMADMRSNTSGNKFVVKAPISGTIVEMDASAGKFTEAGRPLVRIMNTTTLWLKAHVPATEIGRLRNIDTAVFSIQGIDGEFKPKRIVTESDLVDPRTRTITVVFEVNNPKNLLKAGMFTNVAIRTGHAEKALTLPEEAFFEDEGRFFVFVQREGEAFERREIRTGAKDRGYVQIKDGLKEGERVVTKGGYYVKLASQSTRLADPHAGHGH
jgi:membrane fusion protein, heavy metal efflux system